MHTMHTHAIFAVAHAAQSAETSIIAERIAAEKIANASAPIIAPRYAVLVPLNPSIPVSATTANGESEDDPTVPFTDLILARNAYDAALKVFSTSAAMSYELLRTV